MRKIFTLFALLLCAVAVNAQTYEWYIEGETQKETTSGFFTKSTKFSQNAKYVATYVAWDKTIKCTKGLKMESATSITFTTERTSTVTIVQCTSANPAKNFKFDGTAQTSGVENPAGCDAVKVFTIENVQAGEHSITRGDGETGIMYVGVVLAELGAPQLAEPQITYDNTTGMVTIGAVENAVKVVYTTDGSVPNENSTEYTAPFKVEDATEVNAIAIGDDTNYSNSKMATVEVLLVGQTVAAPTFAQFNGTFAITCSTVKSAIEYSLDEGATWNVYTIPVTLAEAKIVQARATREGWTTSEVVSEEIAVLPAVESTKTILMGYGSFVLSTDKHVLGSKEGDAAEGFSLSMTEKTWASANKKVIMGTESRTAMYGSNGAEVTMTIPEGLKVTRITFYSYLDAVGRNAGWDVVAGVQNTSADLVPMGSTDPTNPDVRVFNIENGVGTITFKNIGERPNFAMAVEVVELPKAPEAPALAIESVDFTDATIDLGGKNKTITFKAAEGLDIYYNFEKATAAPNDPTEEEEPGLMTLAETDAPKTIEHEGKTYTIVPAEGLTLTEAGTLSYFAHDPATDLKSEVKTLAVTGNGDTTGIDEIGVDNVAAPVEYFNLQGIRVDNPANGVFIRRQGNKVDKVIL